MTKLIPLSNSELMVEVSEEDHLSLILFGPYYLNENGYPRRSGRPKEYLHQLVAMRMQLQGEVIDHDDRNKLNATRTNLKASTHVDNIINSKAASRSQSGHKYVIWIENRKKWRVKVLKTHIGCYIELEAAIKARDEFIQRFNLKVGEL